MKGPTVKATAGMFLFIGFLLIGIALDIVWAMDGKREHGGTMSPMMSPSMDSPRSMGAVVEMAGLEPPAWRNLSFLGLDAKQKEAVREIKSREVKDNIKKMADVRIADIELRDILDKDPVDMSAVEAKLKWISSLMTDMRLSRIKAIEEIRAKLTPEQNKRFKEILGMGCGMGGPVRDGIKMPPPPPRMDP
ncbi:MAG TPA: periplasmic heavy metal sensor [Syntrophorhabdaceae bacterium]|nr:periplasmic heavy metal sensor [Syntrophorhabdaceae bacterium]HQM81333.1 periplasmic heavy metal sensor [Syntrophorhabdaceae bacterium]